MYTIKIYNISITQKSFCVLLCSPILNVAPANMLYVSFLMCLEIYLKRI